MAELLEAIGPPKALGRGYRLARAISDLRLRTLPVVYQAWIDPNRSGTIEPRERKLLPIWITFKLAEAYEGPACLDYEFPFWKELADLATPPRRLATILTVYRRVLSTAEALRPRARWGFFGFPRYLNLTRQTPEWRARVLAFSDLVRQQGAVFPSIYDARVGDARGRDLEAVRNFVSLCLQAAGNRVPVYVFMSGRYTRATRHPVKGRPLQGEERWIPDAELLGYVEAALRAEWRPRAGRPHRIAGIVLWDGYNQDPPSAWPAMDERHAHQLRLLERSLRRTRPASGRR